MTSKEQTIEYIRQYISARAVGFWIAEYAEQDTIERLQSLGGMTGTWRTDYSECTYHNPQRINGVLVDLSTIVKVRAFYEASTVGETPRT